MTYFHANRDILTMLIAPSARPLQSAGNTDATSIVNIKFSRESPFSTDWRYTVNFVVTNNVDKLAAIDDMTFADTRILYLR